MRLLSSKNLLGLALLLPTAVTANGPIVETNVYDNNNGNVCTTEVTLDCTYVDSNGRVGSCISETSQNGEIVPWLYVPAEDCGQDIRPQITMKICNLNGSNEFDTTGAAIIPDPNSQFTIKGVRQLPYPFPEIKSGRSNCLNVSFPSPPEFLLCKAYPIKALLEGKMKGRTGNRYCYGFAFNKSKSKKIAPPPQLPAQTFTEQCSTRSDITDNVCNASVSIACTYEENGQKYSCIGPDRDFTFYSIREDKCAAKKIQAEITMQMCNLNQLNQPFNPAPSITNLLADDSTYFRFKGQDYNSEIPGFGNDLPPPPNGNCVTYTKIEEIDTCKKNWPMSVQLEGNMTAPAVGNSYCYCYLFKKALVEKFPGPPPGPTQPPSTNVPLIITEVTDPVPVNGQVPPRYVKLLKTPSSSPIIPDLKLVILRPDGQPDWPTAIPISDGDFRLGSNGPEYKICNFQADRANAACDKLSTTPIANRPGCYTLAVVTGSATTASTIYDVFGVIGDCEGTPADFGGGKATRKPGFTDPKNPWVPEEWVVTTPPPPEDEVPLVITEVTDPVPVNGEVPPRYVKLLKTPSSSPIIDDLKLVILKPNGTPDWPTAIPISEEDWPTTTDGPDYKICNFAENVGGSGCDKVSNTSIANRSGCYTLAVVKGSATTQYTTYDVFGVIGDCEGTPADFGGGSATRKPGFTDPKNPWVPEEWDVVPGDGLDEFLAIITEVTDPPSSSPNTPPPRYVEVQVLGTPLAPDLSLVLIDENSPSLQPQPVWNTRIPISNLEPTSEGKIYVCNTQAYIGTPNVCDAISYPIPGIANISGCYTLAIVRGDQTTFNSPADIVDIFGVVNNCDGSDADFGGGKATRKPGAMTPRKTWVPNDWVVTGPPPSDLILFITEIADPTDGENNRFVELYSPNKRNYIITPEDNIYLMRFVGNSATPALYPALNLSSFKINENGFLVLCVTDDCYGDKCDYVLGPNSIANNPGDVDVALKRGPPTPYDASDLIDIYGVPGEFVLPAQNFIGGRAVRRPDSIAPNNICVTDNWFVVPGGVLGGETITCADAMPGCWNGIGDCDMPSPPTPSPFPGPSKGGSPSKNPPSKNPPSKNNPSKGKDNKRVRRLRRGTVQ